VMVEQLFCAAHGRILVCLPLLASGGVRFGMIALVLVWMLCADFAPPLQYLDDAEAMEKQLLEAALLESMVASFASSIKK
jgi:hypothetical protein